MLAIVGANLIDGRGGPPLRDAVVLIDGETIAAVGPAAEVEVPRDAERVDAAGAWLLPGLIDCHLHLAADAQGDPYRALHELTPYVAIRCAVHAERTQRAGFTTIRDLGALGYANVAAKQAIDEGLVPGPRVLPAGHMLGITGRVEDGTWRTELSFQHEGRVDSPDEARRAARRQLYLGAECIKLAASGRLGGHGGNPLQAQLTIEEMAAAVEEARKYGKHAAAHAYGPEAIRNAVLAGVRSIEHGSFLDRPTAELMAERGVWLVPTLSTFWHKVTHGQEAGIKPSILDRSKRIWEGAQNAVRLAGECGIQIALGTDTGMPMVEHGKNAREVELLVGCGLSPTEAIQAGTSVAARLLMLDDQIGTVEPGKQADLALFADDPLADPTALQRPPRLVLRAGQRVRTDDLAPS